MSDYASLDDLTSESPVDQTADVELSGGRRVKVRGLSRYELLLNGKGTDDSAEIERRNLACCMVEPKLNVAAVEKWQKNSKPGDIGKVTDAIRALSGLGEDARKSDVSDDGDDGA